MEVFYKSSAFKNFVKLSEKIYVLGSFLTKTQAEDLGIFYQKRYPGAILFCFFVLLNFFAKRL